MKVLVWDNNEVKQINSYVRAGYASITLSEPKIVAAVTPANNSTWIAILAIVFAIVIFFAVFMLINIKSFRIGSHKEKSTDAGNINLNAIPARNNSCKKKVKAPTPQELKEEKEKISDPIEKQEQEEKAKKAREKLGKGKNQVE